MKELISYLKRNKITHLYHATYGPVLDYIELYGLGANPPERINAWEGLSSENLVYLAHTPDAAEAFAENADNEELPEEWLWDIVILEVKIDDLNIDQLSFDSNHQIEEPFKTFQYQGIIPWNLIKICE